MHSTSYLRTFICELILVHVEKGVLESTDSLVILPL